MIAAIPTLKVLLPEPDPGHGGIGALLHFETEIRIAAEQFRASEQSGMSGVNQLHALRSATITRLTRALESEVLPLERLAISELETLVSATGSYKRELESLVTDSQRLRHEIEDLRVRHDFGMQELAALAAGHEAAIRVVWNENLPVHLTQTSSATTLAFDGSIAGVSHANEVLGEPWYVAAVAHNLRVREFGELTGRWSALQELRREAEYRFQSQLMQVLHALELGVARAARLAAEIETEAVDHGMALMTPTTSNRLGPVLGDDINTAFMPPDKAEAMLAAALANPEAAYIAMGFAGTSLTLASFTNQAQRLQAELRRAQSDQQPANLVAFGRRGHALTAAISYGDLADADRVSVVVPGMLSTVGNIASLSRSAQNIYQGVYQRTQLPTEQHSDHSDTGQQPSRDAVVAWMGYDSPEIPQEPWMRHAHMGSSALADALGELRAHTAQPGGPGADRWIGVVAHSYGSTTAAEALKISDAPVDVFATVGSAGLAVGTRRSDLAARRVVAATAQPRATSLSGSEFSLTQPYRGGTSRDYIAPFGKTFGAHNVDPRSLKGARVTPMPGHHQHTIWTPPEKKALGYLAARSEALEMVVREHSNGRGGGR